MALTGSNADKPKARHASGGILINEEIWAGHAQDHNVLAATSLGVYGATFIIGAEAGNIINVAIQLSDMTGGVGSKVRTVQAFLSDDVGGIGISAAAPDGSVVIGTDGAIIVTHVADLAWMLQSEDDGDIDIDINDVTGTPTWYLVIVLSDGTHAVSDAITFA